MPKRTTPDLVTLCPTHYPAWDAQLVETTVVDYHGAFLLEGDEVTLTHGAHAGAYAHTNDRQLIELLGDEYCLKSDHYATTYDGDYFYEGEADRHNLVEAADTGDYHPQYDCVRCIVGGHSRYTAEWGHVYDEDAVTYNNSDHNRYHNNVLDDFDITENGVGDHYFRDDIEEEEEESDDNPDNASYHSLRRGDKTTPATRFTVGFEVEKEDHAASRISYGALREATAWVKEADGSLNDEIGYELVSPTLDLMDDQLDRDLAGSADLRQLIDASSSRKCGGHINFGIVGQDGQQVCDQAAGWFPLIYAMYPGRSNGTVSAYAGAVRLSLVKGCMSSKSFAVTVHQNRIEFRVFSAVRSVRNLLWRRDLLRLLATNLGLEAGAVLEMALDTDSPLHVHLRRVYAEPQLLELVGRAVVFFQNLEAQPLDVKLVLTGKQGALTSSPHQLALALENVTVLTPLEA